MVILQALYFFLPAYVANMSPVIFKKVPFLEVPLNEKVFGKNKTWRGLVFGTVFGALTFVVQQQLYANNILQRLALIDYSGYGISLGVALAFGALAGDAIKSYFKRKNKIKAGMPWIPYDQLDFVVGALLLSSFWYVLTVEALLTLVILTPFLHIGTNHLGYYLKIRKSKF